MSRRRRVWRARERSFGLPALAADEAVASMALGAVRTMRESGLTPGEVLDLVPVHPLADEEEGWKAAYRARLGAVLERIRPAAAAYATAAQAGVPTLR